MQCYSHLSDDEREQIGLARTLGHSIGAIAQAIGRPKSTISRELSRNKLPSGRCLQPARNLLGGPPLREAVDNEGPEGAIAFDQRGRCRSPTITSRVRLLRHIWIIGIRARSSLSK
jgi:hypothetical protein